MGNLMPTGETRVDPGPPDRDLEEMLCLMKRLEGKLAMADLAGAQAAVRTLGGHAEHHFRREQALLRSRGFPRLHDHARLHETALLMIERIEFGLDSGDLDGAQGLVVDLSAYVHGVLRQRNVEYAGFLANGRHQFETEFLDG